MSIAKRSVANPPRWVLEPKGLRGFVRFQEQQFGDSPIPFGGHHQSLLATAAHRADSELFLCHPYRNIPGFEARLVGEDQVWASKARAFMQDGRITIRARRSADAAEMLRVPYTSDSLPEVGGISAVDAVVHEVCNRLLVPPPSTRPCEEILKRMMLPNGWCDLKKEMGETCPMPNCKTPEGYMHQVQHLSKCGKGNQRPEGKSKGSAIHYTSLRLLAKMVYESIGIKSLLEVKCTFLGNDNYSIDLIIPMANGKDIMVDVTGVNPYAQAVRAKINRVRGDTGVRMAPGKLVGTDYQDEVAGCHGCIRKYSEIGETVPRHRLVAGHMTFASSTNKRKIIKHRSQYIFRDFVVQPTGKLGDGARGVLVMLAKMKREWRGKSRSMEVDAQVKKWARQIAKTITFQDAKHTINYNLKVSRAAMERQLKRRTAALRREAIPGDGQETDVSEDEEGQEAVDSEDEDAQNADPAGLQGPQNPARPPAPEPLHGV